MKNLILLSMLCSGAMAEGYMQNGKMYLYVNSETNIIQCQVQQLCDIALAPGDIFQSWIMTNGEAWVDSAKAKTTYNDNKGIQHVVLQATGKSSRNPVILVGVNNQYHFDLVATEKAKTNKYIFIDKKDNSFNSTNAVIDNGVTLDFTGKKIDSEYYFKGDTDSFLMPVKVFNDGRKTYIQMPENIDTTDLPTVYSFGAQGQLMQLNNPRYRKPYFIVDNILQRISIVSGSVDNDNQVRIDIYKGKPPGFFKWLTQQYDKD
jgi:type IV secretory pathway VirB9-like protein